MQVLSSIKLQKEGEILDWYPDIQWLFEIPEDQIESQLRIVGRPETMVVINPVDLVAKPIR